MEEQWERERRRFGSGRGGKDQPPHRGQAPRDRDRGDVDDDNAHLVDEEEVDPDDLAEEDKAKVRVKEEPADYVEGDDVGGIEDDLPLTVPVTSTSKRTSSSSSSVLPIAAARSTISTECSRTCRRSKTIWPKSKKPRAPRRKRRKASVTILVAT